MNKFFAFVWVVLTLTSCLDEHPKNLLTEDEAYSSARNLYVNAVATLYNHIGGKATARVYKVLIGVCTTTIRSAQTKQ